MSCVHSSFSIAELVFSIVFFYVAGDVNKILALLDEENKKNPQDYGNPFAHFKHVMDTPDHSGNTPLLLAIKLGHVELAKLLIAEGFQCDITSKLHLIHEEGSPTSVPILRQGPGFHLLDESVLTRDIPLIKSVYKQMQRNSYRLWLEKKAHVLKTLLEIPDFYVELNWEFLGSGEIL